MDPSPETNKVKLNIFALPSQTTILFGLIVAVLLGTVLVGSIDPSLPACMRPLPLTLLVLSLRRFLGWPEREMARHDLQPAGDDLAALRQAIAEDVQDIGLPRVPQLVVGPDKRLIKTFGSFRHWYIAMGRERALDWQKKLKDPKEASATHAGLIHELHHFKNGDYWQMGYARELLLVVAIFSIWVMALSTGFGVFLLLVRPHLVQFDPVGFVNKIQTLTPEARQIFLQLLPSVEAMAEFREQASIIDPLLSTTLITSAVLPLILAGVILWLVYWRKLLRVREFYADAGAVHIQKETDPLRSILAGIPLRFLQAYPDSDTPADLRQKGEGFWSKTKKLISKLWDFHPDLATRIVCWQEPSKAFDTWGGAAILAGSLILILDIVLASSPLTLLYIGQWPMHFSTLAIFVVVSLWVITPLALGKIAWPDTLKIIAIVVGLRLAWLAMTIGVLATLLFLAPAVLSDILTTAVANTARYSGPLEGPAFPDLNAFVLEASLSNTAQVFILLFVLVVAIGVSVWLIRRLLTWYGFLQTDKRFEWTVYLIIGASVTFWGLTVLPLLTTTLLRPTELLNPTGILGGVVGFLIAAIGLGLFFHADRRYGRRCPSCGGFVDGAYYLGKLCPNADCKKLLHPWLRVEYDA